MDLKGKKINFLGDSITEGTGASSIENRYATLTADILGAVECNYGIGGTRIARQQTPSENPVYDRYFGQRVAEMDPDAEVVIIFGGTNDFGHGDAVIGEFSDSTDDTFYGALHNLYRSVIEKFFDKRIVVLTPLHRLLEDNPCGTHGGSVAYGTLKEYVDVIREVAEYYSLPVLDLYAMSGIQPNVPIIKESFMPDGLHPNDEGHRLLAEKIAAYLKII